MARLGFGGFVTKIACVAVVKNEAPHIAEWIAYQLVIGFDTVIILDNLSTDDTKNIALAFAPRFDVRVVAAPFEGANFQGLAYLLALEKFGREFAWMAFFDADEFLVLDGGKPVKEALAPLAGINAVAVNWAVFSASRHVTRPAGLTISNYFLRPELPDKVNRHVKSILRPERVRAYKNPHFFDVAGGYFDLAGREVDWEVDGIIAGLPTHAGGRLHHYFTRSFEDFKAKLARGYRDLTRPLSAFESHNQTSERDDSAAVYAPAVQQVLARVRGAPVPTCAVVLMVKNEAHDIAAWLGWYHVLGFDACIVFDDDSADGTWEILQRAAKIQDIRLYRTMGPKTETADVWRRQHECYRYALQHYRDEFEWLAFFDADEFLSLNFDESVQEFLGRFADADAVGVNWCLYGSNGHIAKPSGLPTEAYTRHGGAHHLINRHVKSFVRPAKLWPGWHNVHWFDVDPKRAQLANGRQASFSETIGIIDEDPDWSVAKVMHFQTRSRAHFEERLAKRPEISGGQNIFESLDLNEVEDTAPRRFTEKVKQHIAKYQVTPDAVKAVVDEGLIFDIGMSEGNDSAFYLAKGFRVVGVEADVQMYFALCERFAGDIADGRMVIHNGAAAFDEGLLVEFFHHQQHQGISSLSRGRPEFADGNFSAYHVLTINWAALTKQHGVPYYCKLDIEGSEEHFLRGMQGQDVLPVYVSAECYSPAPAALLHELGYRHFKLVDQNPTGGFVLPAEQCEGTQVDWQDWRHMSGPFGRDLAGEWGRFEEFESLRQAALAKNAPTWFDCHAWRG